MNFIDEMDAISRNVKHWILLELNSNGFLGDVEQVITSNKNDEPVDTPCVWIVEHPTIPYKGQEADISTQQRVSTTFEFVCIDYDEDLEEAQKKATNLATRVGASILKNRIYPEDEDDPTRLVHKILFQALYPVGEVTIEGKSEKIPASSLVLEFVHVIDWMKCCRQRNNNG